MNHYETRGAALDHFLAEHDVDPEDILSVGLHKHTQAGEDIRVHIYSRVPGLEYIRDEEGSRHTIARVEREDLTIDVVYLLDDDEEVTE